MIGGRDPSLDALSDALRHRDSVPAAVRDAARRSFGHRSTGGEQLARLLFDSLDEPAQMAGVRGGSTRLITFVTDSERDLVEIEVRGPQRTVVGQVAPAGRARVEIRRVEGSVFVDTDELGRFHLNSVEEGPLSIRCHGAGGSIVSDWFRV